MVFPWGSGKSYFDAYQPQYAEVARFIAELTELGKPYGLTVDHLDDMRKSLATLSRSQNTLNDAYEYHWDHRGNISLNPNQTGSEAVLPFINLNVWDSNAALKVIWGNNSELDNKLSYEHSFCRDCEFLQACNAGWYPHKDMPSETISKYMQPAADAETPCPGFYELWQRQAVTCFDPIGVTRYGDQRRVRKHQRLAAAERMAPVSMDEGDYINRYDAFFDSVSRSTHVAVSNIELFGLTPRQRLWFYDRLGKQVRFEGGLLDFEEASSIIAHAVAGNFHTIFVGAAEVAQFLEAKPDHSLSHFIQDALLVARCWETFDIRVEAGFTKLGGSELEISFKYEDLLLWATANKESFSSPAVRVNQHELYLTPASYDYMTRLKVSAYRISRAAIRK